MSEVQKHGFDFENWIKKTFLQQFSQTSYTAKWDVSSGIFRPQYSRYTSNLSGLPISIKTCKYGCPIGFGDAIRQFENTQDFLLIAGFWRMSSGGKKFVSANAARISAEKWHKLFENTVTMHELKKDELRVSDVKTKLYQLDKTIKMTPSYLDARKMARSEKKGFPAIDIVLNPKIDSKNQRRLQCSLPFRIFWNVFAGEAPTINENCTLWGEKIPILS